MSDLTYSRHAEVRMNQRGVRPFDIELILQCGSEIGDDVYFLSRKDAERAIRRRKSEIQALERLSNHKLVRAGDTIVTCYRSERHDQRRMLQDRRESL